MGQEQTHAGTAGRPARRAAVDLVVAVTEEGDLLSECAEERLADLQAADRARALRLATETLRWAQRADRLIGPHLRHKPAPRTHAILRLATYELCALGTTPHGVVNDAVALTKATQDTARQAGLVNAVLRKLAASAPAWESLPAPSLPKWLRKPLITAYGKAAVAAIEAAHAKGAPTDITPGASAPDDLAGQLGATPLPLGTLRLAEAGQMSRLPGFEDGWWWVQDWAAALPARLLDPAPDAHVIDLCAAPGGKTMQLAAAGARVDAVDSSARRMTRLDENLARTGLRATTHVADALTWRPTSLADAVLLDAPCSATGTIRRHPDLPHAKSSLDLDALTTLQARLLDAALSMLKPGGRLVYATCSLLPEEGDAQIENALSRHPGLRVDMAALERPGIEAEWLVEGTGLRLRPDFWPEAGGMDGFFVSVLQKPAENAGGR